MSTLLQYGRNCEQRGVVDRCFPFAELCREVLKLLMLTPDERHSILGVVLAVALGVEFICRSPRVLRGLRVPS